MNTSGYAHLKKPIGKFTNTLFQSEFNGNVFSPFHSQRKRFIWKKRMQNI